MESTFFIPQSSSIKTIVHSFWHMEGETVYKTETILPKGIVEIIFNFSDHCSIQAELGAGFGNRSAVAQVVLSEVEPRIVKGRHRLVLQQA